MRACIPRNRSRRPQTRYPPASEETLPFSPPAIQTTALSGVSTRTRERFPVKSPTMLICSFLAAFSGLGGCQKSEVTAAVPAPAAESAPAAASPPPAIQIMASIQELMDAVIDP